MQLTAGGWPIRTRRWAPGPILALAALVAGPCSAQGWMLTLLDGEAVIIDGTRRLAAEPGLRVGAGTLVETGRSTALVRFEGPEQATIDLGPDTRVMLAPASAASRQGGAPSLYLQQGSVKLASRAGTTVPGLVAPGLEVMPFTGSAVVQVAPDEQAVFAEANRLELGERRAGGALRVLNGGEFYSRVGKRAGSVAARPTADWLRQVPRAFRDPLPLRAAVWLDKPSAPKVLPGPTYEQLARWLSAESYVRHDFVSRFTPLTRDAAFRRGLQSHLSAHPEWAAVLNPDLK